MMRSRSSVRGPHTWVLVRPNAASTLWHRSRTARAGRAVSAIRTAFRKGGWSGPPTGLVSKTGDTATNATSGASNKASRPSCRYASRSPRLLPMAITTRTAVCSVSCPRPPDRDRHIVERMGDGRVGFVDGDLRLLDRRIGQARGHEPLRQGLDQLYRRISGQVRQPAGQGAVVHGLAQVVPGRRGPGVQP